MIYIGVINAVNIGYSELKTRFGFSDNEAGTLFTMPYVISAALSLPVGWFVEKYGYRTTLTITGSVTMFCCHAV